MIPRRILTATDIGPALRVKAASDPHLVCNRTILLDGRTYRCGREVRTFDRQHDGIHDAFQQHRGDGGEVRW